MVTKEEAQFILDVADDYSDSKTDWGHIDIDGRAHL